MSAAGVGLKSSSDKMISKRTSGAAVVLFFLSVLCNWICANAFVQLSAANQRFSVATRATVQRKQDESQVPYKISRGDGSTGGGGLPMPNRKQEQEQQQVDDNDDDDDDDHLVRPKVSILCQHRKSCQEHMENVLIAVRIGWGRDAKGASILVSSTRSIAR